MSAAAITPETEDEYFYLINTHTEANDKGRDLWENRQLQLEEIMADLADIREPTHPVIFVGDLNIIGGSIEWCNRLDDLEAWAPASWGAFNRWDDIVTDLIGNAAIPYTSDKARNAYAYHWFDGDKIDTTIGIPSHKR